MSITSIQLKPVRSTQELDPNQPISGKPMRVIIDCDGGAVSVFLYGPGTSGRIGDKLRAPYEFAISTAQPGRYKIVAEQYHGPKRIDQRIEFVDVEPPKSAETRRVGVVDLAKLPLDVIANLIRDAGINSSREWFATAGFTNYRKRDLSDVRAYAELGITPTFCFAQSGMTRAIAARVDIAAWTTSATLDIRQQLGQHSFRIELGNEINLRNSAGRGPFWDIGESTLKQQVTSYIDLVQKPMFAAIKKIDPNIECVAPAFSWDHQSLETFADQLLQHADGLAFHPYPNGVTDADFERIDRAGEIATKRGKRMAFTELQFNYGKRLKSGEITAAQWAAHLAILFQRCADAGVKDIHYFCAIDIATSNSGAALFNKIGKRFVPTPFHDAFVKALASESQIN